MHGPLNVKIYFVTIPAFTVRCCKHLTQPPKPEDHPLSAARDCFFSTFGATLHTGGLSSIRNPTTHHAVMTGTHISRVDNYH